VLANLPYEEPWKNLLDNYFNDLEYPNREAVNRLGYNGVGYWSLSDLGTIMLHEYIRWRNQKLSEGLPRSEVLRYGE